MSFLLNLSLYSSVLLVSLAACGGDESTAPEEPTWFADVQPLIKVACASCHGSRPSSPAIEGFRLDRYVKNDADTFDAYDYQDLIIAHAVNRDAPAMPPSGELSAIAKETLRRWVDQGAPKGTRENTLPDAELLDPTTAPPTADQLLALSIRSFDGDGDGLVVDVGYRNLDGTDEVLLFEGLMTGPVDIEMDTGQLVSLGHFQIFTRLDDGFSDEPADNKHDVVLIEDLLIDHGVRGTAPTVAVLNPNGGDTLLGPTAITWAANDPDVGDVLTIDIDLLTLDTAGLVIDTTSLATGLANSPASFDWDPSNVPTESGGNPIPYKIRVTATDAGAQNTRSDTSDTSFTIATGGGPTDLTWDDIKPIFVTYCGMCHAQPARTMALEYFRMDKYNAADIEAPANSDIGAFEMRSQIYQRMIVAESMPPNARPQPSQAEVNQIREWILAGAPFGGGGDAPPSFSWITPNNSATTVVGNASITIAWTANDPEGLPITGSISFAELPNGIPPLNNMNATCDGSESGYTEIVGNANIEDGSFSFTLPGAGFFCFKAQVSDDAGQIVTALATRPVHY